MEDFYRIVNVIIQKFTKVGVIIILQINQIKINADHIGSLLLRLPLLPFTIVHLFETRLKAPIKTSVMHCYICHVLFKIKKLQYCCINLVYNILHLYK